MVQSSFFKYLQYLTCFFIPNPRPHIFLHLTSHLLLCTVPVTQPKCLGMKSMPSVPSSQKKELILKTCKIARLCPYLLPDCTFKHAACLCICKTSPHIFSLVIQIQNCFYISTGSALRTHSHGLATPV